MKGTTTCHGRKPSTETPSRSRLQLPNAWQPDSAAVRLIHAPLDLTEVEVLEGIEGTRAAMRSAYRAGGKKHDQQEQWANAEAANLYGLAVGVALGRGSVR